MSTQEVKSVDFSHPDIVFARGKVYALLLRWRKERAGQRERQGEHRRRGECDQDGKEGNELDMSGILRATEEGPASAPTETGLR